MAYAVSITPFGSSTPVDVTDLIVGSSFRVSLKRGRLPGQCNFTIRDFSNVITAGVESEIAIVDGATVIFKGRWRQRTRRTAGRSSQRYIDVGAVSYTALADDITLGFPTARPALRGSETDRARISGFVDDAWNIGATMSLDYISSATTFIASTMTLPAQTYGFRSLAQGISDVCSVTGGEWYIDDSKLVHYFVGDEGLAAPFSLSDTPNNSTSFGFEGFAWRDDSTAMRNKATPQSGTVGSTSADDSTSIAAYGIRSASWLDTSIEDATTLQAIADAYIARNSLPQETISLTCYRAGLKPGQTVTIVHSGYSLNDAYPVAGVDISAISPTQLKYDVSFGAALPDFAEVVQRIIAAGGRSMTPAG